MFIHIIFVALQNLCPDMIKIFNKNQQAYGEFNNGDIIENKPIGFTQDGGSLPAYSNLFYWAHAEGIEESTIGLHPHRGFEIMSVVVKGSIEHYDTLLQKWIKLEAGDVQLIKSGAGISHAEKLLAGSSIFQIWFYPDLRKCLSKPAEYKDCKKGDFLKEDNTTTIIDEDSPIQLESEGITMKMIEFQESFSIECDKDYFYSIYIIEGELKDSQQVCLQKDYFILAENEESLQFEVSEGGYLIYIKSPITVSYPTY
jgi:quercetin 2,3-dioxygenase